ncbi:hypothetical protein M407DRAFT_24889 [Tulasnella calospora MUT 4182]|uniref:Fork-head domain-containing protein n=1 Tax=Tulasnella calospora MUT 4182 TaxID=1051891 RepID=A0A0C3Q7T6_9AGAM|nr:hypothetical protein M407DRAFT_24889 [Tulasnella calospora MUT 4182]
MAQPKHSERSSSPPLHHRPRLGRHFGGQKRLTVAEVAAVVLMHAPGKMLRTGEIAAGAQKMFVPRYDDPKALSKFRSSLRHELSKFKDSKFFRVPKEHGRAGRGDFWVYVGDGDPRTLALVDRIIQERGRAKDYSKRNHTFEVVAQKPAAQSSAPKAVVTPSDDPLPATLTGPTAPQIRSPTLYAPTPIFHPSVQPQSPLVTDSLPFQYETLPNPAASPASLSSEIFEAVPLATATSTKALATEGKPVPSQGPELLGFTLPIPPTQPPPFRDPEWSLSHPQYLWGLYNIYFGEQSFQTV